MLRTKIKNEFWGEKTHVEEEGPKRGFSLRGWKENLPRKEPTQESRGEFLGQSFTYMVTMNTTMLVTTKVGTSHGNHCLKSLKSRSWVGGGGDGLRTGGGGVGGEPRPWWTVESSRRGSTLTSTLPPYGSFSLPIMMIDPFHQRFQLFNTLW